MREVTYAEAVREALDEEMSRDERVCLIGQGVSDFRGIYGTTLGLREKYGASRIIESPLSEAGVTGIAVGMAMAGLRPVMTHIRADFLMLATNQLVNVAAKAKDMWGGQVKVPLVVRAVIGKSWGQGAQHSQGVYPMLCHVPGLKVCAPTSAHDARWQLISAIRDDAPVLFFEHRLLHYERGLIRYPVERDGKRGLPIAPDGLIRDGVVRREGKDITLVGVSWMVVECLKAAGLLQAASISAEVIDPVWLNPFDFFSVACSVRRTRRLLFVENDWTFCGLGSEVVAKLACAGELGGVEVHRMGFVPCACPPSKPLEDAFYPNAAQIAARAFEMITGERRDFDGGKEQTPIASTTRSF